MSMETARGPNRRMTSEFGQRVRVSGMGKAETDKALHSTNMDYHDEKKRNYSGHAARNGGDPKNTSDKALVYGLLPPVVSGATTTGDVHNLQKGKLTVPTRVMCDRTASGPTYDALEMNQTRGLATKYNDEYANPGARRANARFTNCRTGSTVPLGGDFTGIARSKDDYQNRGGAGGHNKGQKKNTSHGGMISGWTGEVQDGFSTQHRATHKDLGKTPRTLRFGDDYEYSLERARSDVPLKTTKDGYPLPTTKNLFDSPRYATLGSLSFPQQDRTSIGVPLF